MPTNMETNLETKDIREIKEIRIESPPGRRGDAVDRLREFLDLVAGSRSPYTAPYRSLYVYVDIIYGSQSDTSGDGGRLPDMISTLTILLDTGTTTAHVYHIDVLTFGSSAFETPGFRGQKTLKDILESDEFPKVFYDVRPASYALSTEYGVSLDWVVDIQLLESTARKRTVDRRYLRSLPECLKKYSLACIDGVYGHPVYYRYQEFHRARRLKAHDGSSTALSSRPTSAFILRSCTSMVQYLPKLWSMFSGRENKHRLQDLILIPSTWDRVSRSRLAPPARYPGKQEAAQWNQFEHTLLDMIHSQHISPSGSYVEHFPTNSSIPIRAHGWPRASTETIAAILALEDPDTIQATLDQADGTRPALGLPLLDPWSDHLPSFLEDFIRTLASATSGNENRSVLLDSVRHLDRTVRQLTSGQNVIMQEYTRLINALTIEMDSLQRELDRAEAPPSDLDLRRGDALMDLNELKHLLVEDMKIQNRVTSLIVGLKALLVDLVRQVDPQDRDDLRVFRQRFDINSKGYFEERRDHNAQPSVARQSRA